MPDWKTDSEARDHAAVSFSQTPHARRRVRGRHALNQVWWPPNQPPNQVWWPPNQPMVAPEPAPRTSPPEPAQFLFYRILKGIAHLLRHHPLL